MPLLHAGNDVGVLIFMMSSADISVASTPVSAAPPSAPVSAAPSLPYGPASAAPSAVALTSSMQLSHTGNDVSVLKFVTEFRFTLSLLNAG